MRSLLLTSAAALTAFGTAHAVAVIEPDPLFPGDEYRFAGLIGTNTALDDQYKFIFTPGEDDVLVDLSFSATDRASQLAAILVGRGEADDGFSIKLEQLDIAEGGIASSGVFNFENFHTGDPFSILINGESLSGDTPFTLSVFASEGAGEIPVPAAGFFLMTAIGGLALARRPRP